MPPLPGLLSGPQICAHALPRAWPSPGSLIALSAYLDVAAPHSQVTVEMQPLQIPIKTSCMGGSSAAPLRLTFYSISSHLFLLWLLR